MGKHIHSNIFKLSTILFIGICLQVSFMFFLMNPRTLEWSDAAHYLSIANSLANGHSYGSEPHDLFRSPGYPYFLYFITSIFGNGLILIRIIHIGIHTLFLLGVYKLGQEWKDSKFGLLLTFICSLYPYYIYIPLSIYPESLLIFLSSWIIYLLLKIEKSYKYSDLILACCLISAGALTKPTFLLISFAYFVFVLLSKTFIRNKLNVGVFILIVPTLILSSWGFYNQSIHGRFILSTAASYNLFIGFNENTTIDTKIDCPIPEEIQYHTLLAENELERDSIFKKSALEYIWNNPGRCVYLASFRMIDLWNPIPHTTTKYSISKKVLAGIPYAIILLFSFGGIYRIRKEPITYLFLFILFLNTFINGIFAVSVRYRVVFDIITIMFFTVYLTDLIKRLTVRFNANHN